MPAGVSAPLGRDHGEQVSRPGAAGCCCRQVRTCHCSCRLALPISMPGKQQLMLDASSVCGAIVLRDVRESIESNRCKRCDAAASAKCDSRAMHAGYIEAIVSNARCTRK